jgi:hypothetical protein
MQKKIVKFLRWLKHVSLNYEDDYECYRRILREVEYVRHVNEMKNKYGYTVLF